jgi:hypothetical protein
MVVTHAKSSSGRNAKQTPYFFSHNFGSPPPANTAAQALNFSPQRSSHFEHIKSALFTIAGGQSHGPKSQVLIGLTFKLGRIQIRVLRSHTHSEREGYAISMLDVEALNCRTTKLHKTARNCSHQFISLHRY